MTDKQIASWLQVRSNRIWELRNRIASNELSGNQVMDRIIDIASDLDILASKLRGEA
jgi:hypothetical protein